VSQIFDEGDEIEIDLGKGEVKNLRTGKRASFEPLSGTPLEIFEAGGILPVLKKRVEKES
jgi:3-isopropylmalate dehydratase small subunit